MNKVTVIEFYAGKLALSKDHNGMVILNSNLSKSNDSEERKAAINGMEAAVMAMHAELDIPEATMKSIVETSMQAIDNHYEE